jgi:hypothetical protein
MTPGSMVHKHRATSLIPADSDEKMTERCISRLCLVRRQRPLYGLEFDTVSLQRDEKSHLHLPRLRSVEFHEPMYSYGLQIMSTSFASDC